MDDRPGPPSRGSFFPVQEDDHFFTLLRDVERSALRARLVWRAKDWATSSTNHFTCLTRSH
jgi:hypothetical protein